MLNARSALEAATRTKDAAWEAGRKRYQQDSSGPAADTPGTGTLVDFLEHDEAYLSAWNLEKDTANVLHTLRPPQMEALSEKLEMLRLADKRLEFERG